MFRDHAVARLDRMNRFRTSTSSEAVLAADVSRVWGVLTDPDQLTRMTPYLRRIDADGDRWTWHLARIPVLTTAVRPVFTELMTFDEHRRIGFRPHPGASGEQTGVEGEYLLRPTREGTHVGIDLALWVDLPLPRVARHGVQGVMHTVVAGMGRVFAGNMRRHLGEQAA